MPKPTFSATDSRLLWMGRTAVRGDDVWLGYPGIKLRFVYRGAAPVLRLTAQSEHCYFNLSCNGWDPVVVHLQPGLNLLPLPAGAAPDKGWLVELVRRTEAWQGLVAFHGLAGAETTRLLPVPAWPERRMLFVGDSITSGEYVERFPPGDATSATPRTANAARAFGMLLGQEFDAQVHLVSYGGRGVVRDWQGKTEVANAPQFFHRSLPDDADTPWDHSRYEPDVIVVGLGTNDFSASLPEEAGYISAYAAWVGAIRAVHPSAALVLTESPIFGEMPGTPDRLKRDQLRRTIEGVVARREAAGDRRIAVAPLRHRPGTAADAHPVAFQHELIAGELTGAIRALTGW